MGLLVILVTGRSADVQIGPAAVEALGRLGVTSVTVSRDEQVAAFILEGWAFDPSRPEPVLEALGAAAEGARTLQPLVQMAVSTAQ